MTEFFTPKKVPLYLLISSLGVFSWQNSRPLTVAASPAPIIVKSTPVVSPEIQKKVITKIKEVAPPALVKKNIKRIAKHPVSIAAVVDPIPAIIDEQLESFFPEEMSLAVDVAGPLEGILLTTLQEPSLLAINSDSQVLQTSTLMTTAQQFRLHVARSEAIGTIQKEDFSALRNSFEENKKEGRLVITENVMAPLKRTQVKSFGLLAEATSVPIEENSSNARAINPEIKTQIEEDDSEDNSDADEIVVQVPAQTERLNEIVVENPVQKRSLFSFAANGQLPLVDSQPQSANQRAFQRGDYSIDGTIMGSWRADIQMEEWLKTHQAYPQFYLRPYRRDVDPHQDIIFPEINDESDSSFKFRTSRLEGKFRLYAALYQKQYAEPVAQVVYPTIIDAHNYKKAIIFELNYPEFEKSLEKKPQNSQETAQLYVSVFEGGNGNYREPRRITRGEIRILSAPELGGFTLDSEGNSRINTPLGDVVLEVKCPGYYPAYPIVPLVHSGVEYSRVYLVSIDQVDTISTYFLKRPQNPQKGTLLGTLFDSESHHPKLRDQIRLNSPKPSERPLYFGALPDPHLMFTTDLGKFGFFNVTGLRRLLRPEGARTKTVMIRPGSAEYLELGRNRARTLTGKLLDPSTGEPITSSRVRLLGDARSEVATDENGQFQIKNIDFSSGILDIEAEGAVTFSIPWNPFFPIPPPNLYFIDEAVVNWNASKIAKISREPNTGTLVVGTNPKFLKGKKKCLHASLYDSSGKVVPKEKGPFLFSSEMNVAVPLREYCLSMEQRSFAFYNLTEEEYELKISESDKIIRLHTLHVFQNRTSSKVLE